MNKYTKNENLPFFIQATWKKGIIQHDHPDDKLSKALTNGAILVFKNVFPVDKILRLRRQLLDWARNTPVFDKNKSASVPGINYFRQDDAVGFESPTHMFQQWGFGDWENLPDCASGFLLDMSHSVLELQNRLAGTKYQLGSCDLRIKAYRFPRGGGFQLEHDHAYLPYKALLLTFMSRFGKDHKTNILVRNYSGLVNLSSINIGDVMAMRPDCRHAFLPLDPDTTLDWNSEDGLWFSSVEPTSHLRLNC